MSEAAEAWGAVKDATSLTSLEVYMSRYKDTFYAELARERIEELKKQQIAAAIPPPSARPIAVAPVKEDATKLVQALQTELKRVGCDAGTADGSWGDKAKRALGDFARLSKISIPVEEPTEAALSALKGAEGAHLSPDLSERRNRGQWQVRRQGCPG